MKPALMNAKEVAALLGISHGTWATWKKRGVFKRLEVKQPIGQRRYSRALVDRYISGDAISSYGRRSA